MYFCDEKLSGISSANFRHPSLFFHSKPQKKGSHFCDVKDVLNQHLAAFCFVCVFDLPFINEKANGSKAEDNGRAKKHVAETCWKGSTTEDQWPQVSRSGC
jgi:hypothetical protein